MFSTRNESENNLLVKPSMGAADNKYLVHSAKVDELKRQIGLITRSPISKCESDIFDHPSILDALITVR